MKKLFSCGLFLIACSGIFAQEARSDAQFWGLSGPVQSMTIDRWDEYTGRWKRERTETFNRQGYVVKSRVSGNDLDGEPIVWIVRSEYDTHNRITARKTFRNQQLVAREQIEYKADDSHVVRYYGDDNRIDRTLIVEGMIQVGLFAAEAAPLREITETGKITELATVRTESDRSRLSVQRYGRDGTPLPPTYYYDHNGVRFAVLSSDDEGSIDSATFFLHFRNGGGFEISASENAISISQDANSTLEEVATIPSQTSIDDQFYSFRGPRYGRYDLRVSSVVRWGRDVGAVSCPIITIVDRQDSRGYLVDTTSQGDLTVRRIRMEYTHDSYGNQTSKITYDSRGNILSGVRHAFEYFD